MKEWLKNRTSRRQYELLRMLAFEFKRWKCRISAPKSFITDLDQLQLGSGDRKLNGWLNVDMIGSDLNLDIADGHLPFKDDQFKVIVSQHVIEHLTLEDELIPLMEESFRCLASSGQIWLSTPDMFKVAKSYVEQNSSDMIKDRQTRLPDWNLGEYPSQHFVNDMFHQGLEHRNLFDFELLEWTLNKVGFHNVTRVEEKDLLGVFPEIPARNDDYQSVYVRATKP